MEGGGDCVSSVDGESIFASISGCETEVESSDFLVGVTYVIRFVSKKKSLFILFGGDGVNGYLGFTKLNQSYNLVWLHIVPYC